MSEREEPWPCMRVFFPSERGVSLEEEVWPCGKEVCICEGRCVIVVGGSCP